MVEAGAIYREGRQRLAGLAAGLDEVEAARPVPACPGWAVRDVFAHLAGVCTDSLAGRLDGVTTAAWAEGHVVTRRDRPLADLLAEWEASATPLEDVAADVFPPRLATLWVLDLTAHEHDVRGALRRPGGRDAAGVALAVDFLVTQGLHTTLLARDLGPLEVRSPERTWVVGAQPPATPAAAVSASAFELFRALTGRRSPAQVARLDWTVDPGPFLPAFQFGTFTTRTGDLAE